MEKISGKYLFTPPHCPNPQCLQHRNPKTNEAWFVRRGKKIYHSIPGREEKKVPQYFCKYCKRSFSQVTFEPGYYDKTPTNYSRIIQTAKPEITLKEWANLLEMSSAVLSRRLFKVVGILLRECERVGSQVSQELLEGCRIRLEEEKHTYGVLRELVVQLKKALAVMKNLRRCFPSRLCNPLSTCLLKTLGVWHYIIVKGCTYKPRYPLEC